MSQRGRKQTWPYLYGAEARAATHKHPRTESQIREETVPALPIIRAEVYGQRELQGITEIKLHRRGTSNTEETSQALERMMGGLDEWGIDEGEKLERCVCEREMCSITPNLSPVPPLHLVVFKYTIKQGFNGVT